VIPLPFRPGRALTLFVFLSLSAFGRPGDGSGQGLEELVATCGGGSGTLMVLCHQAALALDGARGGLATAASNGSEVPGSASTLGHRLRSFPRIALAGRAGMTRFSLFDLPDGYELPAGEGAVYIPSIHLSGTLGVLNGFSPVPTVGGVLALDLTASTHRLFLPGGHGFQGGVSGWGMGARLGVLRESFTLPGISFSLTRRWMGSATLGDMAGGGPAETELDMDVTSMRGVIGKDILGLGFVVGAGWDRLSGDGTIRARVSPTGPESMATSSELTSDRLVYFAGGSMTFLILQFSGEVGWSEARNPKLPIVFGGTKLPSARAYFASLALRVTF